MLFLLTRSITSEIDAPFRTRVAILVDAACLSAATRACYRITADDLN